MKVKLTRDFTCYPPNAPGERTTFRKGDIVEGTIARWALGGDNPAGKEYEEPKAKPKAKAAPKKKSAGKAPENK
jgi:hypothetical protein